MRVVNDLLQASDDGHVSILSLLDLPIDTIDHVILNQRFSSTFGCTGTALGWFESYLSNRTQSVLVNDVRSASSILKYGVPHGHLFYHNQRPVYVLCHWVFKPHGHNFHLSAPKSTNKGVNLGSKDITETHPRPESRTVTLTWRASKCKVHKLQQIVLLCFLFCCLFCRGVPGFVLF